MYYIYHIKGVKFGCSVEPENRVKAQGFTDYSIHETHTDIYLASDREQELNREYGYPVDDVPYYISVQNRRKWTQEDSEKGGEANKLSGWMSTLGKSGASGKMQFIEGRGMFGMSDEKKIDARHRGGTTSGNNAKESGQFNKYCSEGGKSHIGKKWMTNGIKNTRVKPEMIQDMLEKGYWFGKINRI
jgi:hypothetical protein